MNIKSNGIPIYQKPNNQTFATLHKIEDGHNVYTMVATKDKEYETLKAKGWKVVEVWKPRKSIRKFKGANV